MSSPALAESRARLGEAVDALQQGVCWSLTGFSNLVTSDHLPTDRGLYPRPNRTTPSGRAGPRPIGYVGCKPTRTVCELHMQPCPLGRDSFKGSWKILLNLSHVSPKNP